MPDRDWDFVHLDLRLDVNVEDGRVEGEAAWKVARLGAAAEVVRLHQAGLDLHAVEVDGTPTEWRVVGEWLEVPVAAEPPAHTLVVRYRAAPQTGLHFRGGPGSPPGEVREVWSQGEGADNRHWFPLWDYPNDRFTVTTTVTVPADLAAFANGRHVSTIDAPGGRRSWTYAQERPITGYLVAIAAGEYTVAERGEHPPLTYVAPRTVSEAELLRSLDRVEAQLGYFQELLGEPFPYPVYRQVMVQRFLYGGMENAGLTILNAHQVRLRDPRESSRHADNLIAHELAHQWFGDLLTCYGWRELWLNEGFATYYAGRWQEHDEGPARMAELARRWTAEALEDRRAPMAARAHSKVEGRENAAVYVRGAAVLHMLRVALGDEVFDAGIRRYVAEHRDRYVESEDLRRALEDVSGRHLGWVFDQWVTGSGAAVLTTGHAWGDGSLTVTITQPDTAAPFVAPVEVEIATEGATRVERAWIGGGTTRLVVALAEPPRYVAVDPRGGVPAEWKHDQTVDAWARQAHEADAPHARLVAIDALGDASAGEAVGPLVEIASRAAEPRAIRTAAARALGRTQVAGAVAALERLTGDPDVDVRHAAIESLGGLQLPDGDGRRTLEAVARNAAEVAEERGAALRALGELDPAAARALARAWLDRLDPTDALHRAAADVLGAHGEASDLARLTARIDEARTPSPALKAVAAAASDVAQRFPDEERPRVALARRLDPLLASWDLRIRQGAIGWLGRVGDERSADALTAFADTNRVTWGDLSSAALDAARLIRAREDPDQPIPPDDLERLLERIAELEARIEELETWR